MASGTRGTQVIRWSSHRTLSTRAGSMGVPGTRSSDSWIARTPEAPRYSCERRSFSTASNTWSKLAMTPRGSSARSCRVSMTTAIIDRTPPEIRKPESASKMSWASRIWCGRKG